MKLYLSKVFLLLSITLYVTSACCSEKDIPTQQSNVADQPAALSDLEVELHRAGCGRLTLLIEARKQMNVVIEGRETLLADLEKKNQGTRWLSGAIQQQVEIRAWIEQERVKIQALKTAPIGDVLKNVPNNTQFIQQYDKLAQGR